MKGITMPEGLDPGSPEARYDQHQQDAEALEKAKDNQEIADDQVGEDDQLGVQGRDAQGEVPESDHEAHLRTQDLARRTVAGTKETYNTTLADNLQHAKDHPDEYPHPDEIDQTK